MPKVCALVLVCCACCGRVKMRRMRMKKMMMRKTTMSATHSCEGHDVASSAAAAWVTQTMGMLGAADKAVESED